MFCNVFTNTDTENHPQRRKQSCYFVQVQLVDSRCVQVNWSRLNCVTYMLFLFGVSKEKIFLFKTNLEKPRVFFLVTHIVHRKGIHNLLVVLELFLFRFFPVWIDMYYMWTPCTVHSIWLCLCSACLLSVCVRWSNRWTSCFSVAILEHLAGIVECLE